MAGRVGVAVTLFVWRHPRPQAAAGRCVGRTDLPVDPRRAKRLAHRIRRHARRHGLPHVVFTSPLQRCASVGRWLARWGWRHIVDERLVELDFGDWEGRLWSEIERAAVDAWGTAFTDHAPGGGESLSRLFSRCERFLAERRLGPGACVVGHAGWMNAARLLYEGRRLPIQAIDWPPAAHYGEMIRC